MHIQDRHENGDRERHGDDGFRARADPHDEHRAERRFRQGVQYHEIRLQYTGEKIAPPQSDRHKRAEQRTEQKSHHRLQTRGAQMQPQVARLIESRKRGYDP